MDANTLYLIYTQFRLLVVLELCYELGMKRSVICTTYSDYTTETRYLKWSCYLLWLKFENNSEKLHIMYVGSHFLMSSVPMDLKSDKCNTRQILCFPIFPAIQYVDICNLSQKRRGGDQSAWWCSCFSFLYT